MDRISFDLEKFEEALSAYSSGTADADAIRTGVNTVIGEIKEAWPGTDDVVAARDNDFQKIEKNLNTIYDYLSSSRDFLAVKKDDLMKAGTAYRG